MKVKDLKAILSTLDDEIEIVMAKDEEGNDYSPLAETSLGVYQPESTWSGEFFAYENMENEDYAQPTENVVPAICLWPVN